jgi:hypothetical protein
MLDTISYPIRITRPMYAIQSLMRLSSASLLQELYNRLGDQNRIATGISEFKR